MLKWCFIKWITWFKSFKNTRIINRLSYHIFQTMIRFIWVNLKVNLAHLKNFFFNICILTFYFNMIIWRIKEKSFLIRISAVFFDISLYFSVAIDQIYVFVNWECIFWFVFMFVISFHYYILKDFFETFTLKKYEFNWRSFFFIFEIYNEIKYIVFGLSIITVVNNYLKNFWNDCS